MVPGGKLLTFFLLFKKNFLYFLPSKGETLVTRMPSKFHASFKLISYSFYFSVSQQGVSTIACITTILMQLP